MQYKRYKIYRKFAILSYVLPELLTFKLKISLKLICEIVKQNYQLLDFIYYCIVVAKFGGHNSARINDMNLVQINKGTFL